jgi:hypothetical protein
MSTWLARLRTLDPETHLSTNGANRANVTPLPSTIGTIGAIAMRVGSETNPAIGAIGTIGTRVGSAKPIPAGGLFLCPGCRRALPASRRHDPDFTICVCCKLERLGRTTSTVRGTAAASPRDGGTRGEN